MEEGINCNDLGIYATNESLDYGGFVMDRVTFDDLEKAIAAMPPLYKRLPSPFSDDDVTPLSYKPDWSWLTGLPITITDHPLTREEWTPPEDPFIEYEPKDYHWLKALGFGKTTTVRTAYGINRRYLTPFC